MISTDPMEYQMSDRKADCNKKGANGRDGMDDEDEAESLLCLEHYFPTLISR